MQTMKGIVSLFQNNFKINVRYFEIFSVLFGENDKFIRVARGVKDLQICRL